MIYVSRCLMRRPVGSKQPAEIAMVGTLAGKKTLEQANQVALAKTADAQAALSTIGTRYSQQTSYCIICNFRESSGLARRFSKQRTLGGFGDRHDGWML